MIKIISVFFIQLGTSDEEGIENFNELINIIKEYFDDGEKRNKNKNLIFVKYDNGGFHKPQVKEGVVATRKWKCLPIPRTTPLQ